MASGHKPETLSSPEARARTLLHTLGAIDVVDAAEQARTIFADAKLIAPVRWLHLELGGYDTLPDVRPLHEVLGIPPTHKLAIEVATYRTQVGRRWAGPTGHDHVAHFFVESLAVLVATRNKIRATHISGLVELSFGPHPSAPQYPTLAEFPSDIFDRILVGFITALRREIGEFAA